MFNEIIVVGRLGKKPETKTVNGKTLATFSVATDEGKDSQTEWHNVVAWDKLAENAAKYLDKGSLVLIRGRLQTRKYESKGETKYRTEIIGSLVKFLDKKTDKPKPESKPDSSPIDDSDIPF